LKGVELVPISCSFVNLSIRLILISTCFAVGNMHEKHLVLASDICFLFGPIVSGLQRRLDICDVITKQNMTLYLSAKNDGCSFFSQQCT